MNPPLAKLSPSPVNTLVFYAEGIRPFYSSNEALTVFFYPRGPGAYTLKDLARATVVGVDILDPRENSVHLKGEEVEFDGKLEPQGLSDVIYGWSVLGGVCDPATARTEDFQTTLRSEGAVRVRLSVRVGGMTLEKTRTIKAVVPEVVRIGWVKDLDMKKWPNGEPITDPVWEKALGGEVTKDEPGAYIKGGAAWAELGIQATESLTRLTSVRVRGVGNKENFYPKDARFHRWTWKPGELVLESSPLYDSVNFYDRLEVRWYYRVQLLNGGWGEWVEMNRSSHILYTVHAKPVADPLYDRGVDIACRYAYGEADFAGAINRTLASKAFYDPSRERHHDLGFFNVDPPIGQCCCHAHVFRELIRQ